MNPTPVCKASSIVHVLCSTVPQVTSCYYRLLTTTDDSCTVRCPGLLSSGLPISGICCTSATVRATAYNNREADHQSCASVIIFASGKMWVRVFTRDIPATSPPSWVGAGGSPSLSRWAQSITAAAALDLIIVSTIAFRLYYLYILLAAAHWTDK
jgi:hypothetical protein